MKKLTSILVYVFFVATTYAATPPDSSKQIPIGYWRTHLSYQSVNQVVETPDRVYGVSQGALFSYDKENNSFDVYSKIDGLSDNTVSLISYSIENKLLLIIYDNSNIDILTDEGKVFNILDIKEKNTSLNKTINSILFYGSKAYLSTGYGISIVDLIKYEISDSYLLSNIIYSTAILDNKIFAASASGLLQADKGANLVDPNNWSLDPNRKYVYIIPFQNKIYGVNKDLGLFELTNNFEKLITSSPHFRMLFVSDNTLVAYGVNQLSIFDTSLKETIIWGQKFYGVSALNPKSKIWFAANIEGINRYDYVDNSYSQIILGLKPDGPLSNSPYKLKFNGEKLMIVGGGAWDDRFQTKAQVLFFENDKWSYINTDTITAQGDVARDFMNIVEDPTEPGHYFITSYGEGVYEFRNKKLVTIHDHTNSSIETVDVLKGKNHFDRTFGICYDKYNNLFITNPLTSNTIKILTSKGQWTSLNYSPVSGKESTFDLLLTKKGPIWLLSAWSSPGIFAFDTKGTISDQTDDQYKFISSINYMDNLETRTIAPENFFCMAEDKNGAIWVGTDMGPIVFNSPSKIFSDNFLGTRVKVPRNDGTMLADYLLENEKISTICVDGGNRKWIGTESNGVYVVSENGQETYAHFTEENSPIFSNKILSIAIHPNSGEVFIGTDKGLVSFRSDAIEGKKDYSNVYAFPNPVRPDYEGYITITGLKAKSTVRITDINGNSLFEGESAGGQIVWDGLNRKGQKPSSGVYLVYAATSDSSEGVITKILMLK